MEPKKSSLASESQKNKCAPLEADENPMALVVLAAQERERLRQQVDRFDAKWYLVRKLYDRGYSREEIIALFKFIDWVIRLSATEEIRLWDELQTLEEVNRMPYVTSVERIGMERGLQQGLQQGAQQGAQQTLLEILDERFGELPDTVSAAIHQIQDLAQLRLLHRQAIRSESLEEFQRALNGT